jgi:hypothetical protein
MNDTTPPQSSVDPHIQAHRAEKALRGAALARQYRDADLAAVGLPPGAIAAISHSARHDDGTHACRTAAALYALASSAGMSDAVERLFIAMQEPTRQEQRGHVFRAPFLARAELARRVLDFATPDAAKPADVAASFAALRPQQQQRAQLLGLWIAEGLEDCGLVNAARELVGPLIESLATVDGSEAGPVRQPNRTLNTRRL